MEELTLLVADDEPIVRTFVRRYVQEHALPVSRIHEAANGQEAIDAALLHSPDLVLLDIRMPGVSGLDAAAAILREKPGTCIIMVTAYNEFEYARSALRAGVTDYLLKPLDPHALTERVRAVIEARKKRAEEAREAQDGEPRPAHPLVDRIRSYVDAHLDADLCLENIARAAHVSPSHCSRTFSRYAGLSISAFVAQRRVEKAVEFLEDTYLSVTDIAESLGFSSPAYFASWFKRMTGGSPMRRRKQRRENMPPF